MKEKKNISRSEQRKRLIIQLEQGVSSLFTGANKRAKTFFLALSFLFSFFFVLHFSKYPNTYPPKQPNNSPTTTTDIINNGLRKVLPRRPRRAHPPGKLRHPCYPRRSAPRPRHRYVSFFTLALEYRSPSFSCSRLFATVTDAPMLAVCIKYSGNVKRREERAHARTRRNADLDHHPRGTLQSHPTDAPS